MPKIALDCQYCGQSYERFPSQAGRFCSRACKDVAHGESMTVDPVKRFLDKVCVTSWCWYWIGALDTTTGYGNFWNGYETIKAHRFSYMYFVAAIPDKSHLDHFLCGRRICVNPHHVEPVSLMENLLRGDRSHLGQWQRDKTHCPYGHPYDEQNTHIDANGRRHCRACNRERQRLYRSI